MNISAILTPVDFSVCSAVAVAYAAELSRLLGASVRVLHVIASRQRPAQEREKPNIDRGVGREALKELEQLVIEFQKEGYRISCKLRWGRPVDEIIAEAAAGDYDLIVMGTRGRNSLARLLRGSTTETLLRKSRCPVVAVRNSIIHEEAWITGML